MFFLRRTRHPLLWQSNGSVAHNRESGLLKHFSALHGQFPTTVQHPASRTTSWWMSRVVLYKVEFPTRQRERESFVEALSFSVSLCLSHSSSWPNEFFTYSSDLFLRVCLNWWCPACGSPSAASKITNYIRVSHSWVFSPGPAVSFSRRWHLI